MSQEMINPMLLLLHMCVTCVKRRGWGFFWFLFFAIPYNSLACNMNPFMNAMPT